MHPTDDDDDDDDGPFPGIWRYIPCLCNLALGLELKLLGRGGDDVLTLDDGNVSAAVGELGDDVVVGVGGEVGLNDDRVAPARRGGMDGEYGSKLGCRRVRASAVRVGRHSRGKIGRRVDERG